MELHWYSMSFCNKMLRHFTSCYHTCSTNSPSFVFVSCQVRFLVYISDHSVTTYSALDVTHVGNQLSLGIFLFSPHSTGRQGEIKCDRIFVGSTGSSVTRQRSDKDQTKIRQRSDKDKVQNNLEWANTQSAVWAGGKMWSQQFISRSQAPVLSQGKSFLRSLCELFCSLNPHVCFKKHPDLYVVFPSSVIGYTFHQEQLKTLVLSTTIFSILITSHMSHISIIFSQLRRVYL